jgi:alkanesulfonate monooxygenase SsuD/methylene tetrahydromethanopterin reductase-like flavin-dependent oxidoreductase (luciferase family)
MEFGIFHEFPSLPGRPDEDAFDEALDRVDVAEQGGLDALWLAELHFDPARSARAEAEPSLMHCYRAQAALLTGSARRADGWSGSRSRMRSAAWC